MIDLHLHSRCSDGALTPTELVRRAKVKGATTISLTDHDTCAGNTEAQLAGERHGVKVIAGVEFSVNVGTSSVHMLGYGVEDVDDEARETLAQLAEGRARRLRKMVARLNDLGIPVSSAEVWREAGEGVVGRLHLARVLKQRRHVPTVREAFTRYLGRNAAAYVSRPRLEAGEAVALIHRMGGVAVLAHPGVVERENPGSLSMVLDELTPHGLDGIEAYYPAHNAEMVADLLNAAGARGLIVTGGSDFHRPDPRGVEICRGTGKLRVPTDTVDVLHRAIAGVRARAHR